MDVPRLNGPVNAIDSHPTGDCGETAGEAGPSRAKDPTDAQHEVNEDPRPRRQQSRKQFETHIPTKDQLVSSINGLPRLVLTKSITPPESNAALAALSKVLEHVKQSESNSGSGKVDTGKLRDILNDRPDVLEVIAPLLSPAQLEELLRDRGTGE